MTSDPAWPRIHAERAWGTCPEPAMARWAMRHFGDRQARSNVMLLDIGCGVGAQACWLDEAGFSVHGIECSTDAINRMNLRNGNVVGHVGDVCRMTMFPDALFDGVVDVCCLQHVEDIDGAMAEVHRVLKPGGRMFSMMAMELCDTEAGMGYMRATQTSDIVRAFPAARWEDVLIGRQRFISPDAPTVITEHWLIHAVRT